MIRKIISSLLCAALLCCMCLGLSACDNKLFKEQQYPVTVNGLTIEKEPQKIVVLSDNLADIISLIGYDIKMVGRSSETDQEFLRVVPSVGTSKDPSISEIVNNEADFVIADSNLSDSARSAIESQNIPILQLESATTLEELEQLYTDLGTALGGSEDGAEKGKKAYKELFETLDKFKSAVRTNTIKTCCYVYLENDKLKTFEKGSLEELIFSYNSAMNILEDLESNQIGVQAIKYGTPTYIFVADEATKSFLKTSEELQNSLAIRNNNIYVIPLKNFHRQGQTYEDTVYNMIDIMFVQSEATPDEATTSSQTGESVSSLYSSDPSSETTATENNIDETAIVANYGEADFEDDEADIIGGDN